MNHESDDDFDDVDDDEDLGALGPESDLFEHPAVPGLAEAISLYPPEILPGLDPLEIITASFTGLNTLQARTILQDPDLLDLVRRTWDRNPPTAGFRRRAAAGDELGRLTMTVLERTGHAASRDVITRLVDDLVEDIHWILLSSSLTSGAASKGRRDSSPDEWRVDDPYVGATVLVAWTGDRFRVDCVPERSRGASLLHLRWSNDTVTSVPVTVEESVELTITVERPADGAALQALAFVDAE